MIRHGIAKRYAKALFELDSDCQADFDALFTLFEKQPKVLAILQTPFINQSEKEQLLTSTLKEQVKPLFLHFIFFVVRKKRLRNLRELFIEYELLVDSHKGIWEAELISGGALPPQAKLELMDKLEKSFNKKITVVEHVSKDLLGGTLFILGNKELDWRMETRMNKLKKHLLGFDVCR